MTKGQGTDWVNTPPPPHSTIFLLLKGRFCKQQLSLSWCDSYKFTRVQWPDICCHPSQYLNSWKLSPKYIRDLPTRIPKYGLNPQTWGETRVSMKFAPGTNKQTNISDSGASVGLPCRGVVHRPDALLCASPHSWLLPPPHTLQVHSSDGVLGASSPLLLLGCCSENFRFILKSKKMC